MQISENVSLQARNSFGFDVSAEYFCAPTSIDEVRETLEWQRKHKHALLILGGGSNTVFTRNVTGLVMHIAIDHLTSDANTSDIMVSVGAGVNWHQLVKTTVFNNQFGLENLALIPGSAGAAPIQNIGAYGKELCDNLISVDVIDRNTGQCNTLTKEECNFAYRHSLFKTPAGASFIVTGINLKLSKEDTPQTHYQALQESLGDTTATAQSIFNHVCQLRESKLPDPSIIGNAGSFFKNPILPRQQVDTLLQEYPELPVYSHSTTHCKVPAAWLIDRAGWKGHRKGPIGVHDRQALVLVNHGGGNGQQIATLAEEIQQDVRQRYNISLEREPVLY